MNFCAELANSAKTAFPDVQVYSNVDTTREWNGSATIEFNEPDEPETRTTLSGAAFVTHSVYAIVRTKTHDEADSFLTQLSGFCAVTAEDLFSNHTIHAWAIDELGTTADSRGIVEGESFYGYVKVLLTEKITNGCN